MSGHVDADAGARARVHQHPPAQASDSLRLSCRGHKRKLPEEDAGSASSGESSGEDEEGSSSEADEMAAALEAELNDLM